MSRHAQQEASFEHHLTSCLDHRHTKVDSFDRGHSSKMPSANDAKCQWNPPDPWLWISYQLLLAFPNWLLIEPGHLLPFGRFCHSPRGAQQLIAIHSRSTDRGTRSWSILDMLDPRWWPYMALLCNKSHPQNWMGWHENLSETQPFSGSSGTPQLRVVEIARRWSHKWCHI